MNDEENKIRRELEAITGRPGPLPAELDAAGVTLREAWLAFGRLLDEAEAPLAEPADTWHATRTGEVSPDRQTSCPSGREARWGARRRTYATAIAVAVSVLVAVATVGILHEPDALPPSAPGNEDLAVDRLVPPVIPKSLPPVPDSRMQMQEEAPRIATTEAAEWNDSIDEEITSVAKAVIRVQEEWYARAGSFDAIHHGLDQVEEDINHGTL